MNTGSLNNLATHSSRPFHQHTKSGPIIPSPIKVGQAYNPSSQNPYNNQSPLQQMSPNFINPFPKIKKPRKKAPQSDANDILDIHLTKQRVLFEKMGDLVAQQQSSSSEVYKSEGLERLKQLEMEQQLTDLRINRQITHNHHNHSLPKHRQVLDHTPNLPSIRKKSKKEAGGFKMQDLLYGMMLKKIFEKGNDEAESSSSSSSEDEAVPQQQMRQPFPQYPPPYGMQPQMMFGGPQPVRQFDETSIATSRRKKTLKKKNTKVAKGPSPEEIRKQEEERKQVALKNVRQVTWAMAYYQLLHASVREKVLAKKEAVQSQINDKISLCYDSMKSFVIEHSGKFISAMIQDKNHNYIFVTDKKPNDKKLDKMLQALCVRKNGGNVQNKDHFSHILDKMVNQSKNIPKHIFEFLAEFSEDGSVLPYDFISEFELRRLQFNHYGSLKDQNPAKSKLLIGGLIILRLFIQRCIMKCTDSLKIPQKNVNLEKLLNIGSFIYQISHEVIRSSAIAYPKNQDHLHTEYKIKPKKNLHKALEAYDNDPALNIKIDKDPTKDGEVLEGFYSKATMEVIFKQRPKMIEKVKGLVVAWLDKLYELSHAEYQKQKGKEKK